MKKTLYLLILYIFATGCAQSSRYVQSVRFPEDATPEEKVEMAARVVPSRKQLQWQSLELTAERRPDLMKEYLDRPHDELTRKERAVLDKYR
jgi:hypothetical protein